MACSGVTHIPIESSQKEESVVFRANLAVRTVEKVIRDLLFCYRRGCDSTTVKLKKLKKNLMLWIFNINVWMDTTSELQEMSLV